MADTSFFQTDHAIDTSARRPSLLRRAFDAMIEARTRQAGKMVAAHIATLDPKTRAKYDIGNAVVGKNGVYVWPL